MPCSTHLYACLLHRAILPFCVKLMLTSCVEDADFCVTTPYWRRYPPVIMHPSPKPAWSTSYRGKPVRLHQLCRYACYITVCGLTQSRWFAFWRRGSTYTALPETTSDASGLSLQCLYLHCLLVLLPVGRPSGLLRLLRASVFALVSDRRSLSDTAPSRRLPRACTKSCVGRKRSGSTPGTRV